MNLKINPLDPNNPMSWGDAAAVAAISAFAIWVLTFLANASMGQIRADPTAFAFDAVKTYLIAWAGNFLTFSGLKELLKEKE